MAELEELEEQLEDSIRWAAISSCSSACSFLCSPDRVQCRPAALPSRLPWATFLAQPHTQPAPCTLRPRSTERTPLGRSEGNHLFFNDTLPLPLQGRHWTAQEGG